MPVGPVRIVHYVATDGTDAFDDHSRVGSGVSELRLDVGAGYRVYHDRDGNDVVLLSGGTDSPVELRAAAEGVRVGTQRGGRELMQFDVDRHLGAVERSVSSLEREGRPARAVTLSRSYETTVQDLWDAVTSGERIPRWFLPISGDLRLGGRFQLEGNAGGAIEACEPPSRIALTWEFGGDVSWVEVRVADAGDGAARLTLTHTQHLSNPWEQYGPGATGVGWEMALLGIAVHIAQPDAPKPDEAAFAASADGRALIIGSSEGWERAAVAAGEDPAVAHAAATRTTAFYTGEPEPD